MIKLYSLGISGTLFGLLASTTILSSPAHAVSPSSYQSSCRNIRISSDLLSASCRTIAGSYRNSSIRIQGIENRDGYLYFTRLGVASSYQRSCRNIGIAGATLTASCRRINGTYRGTSIFIPGIKNINGDLSY
jgi:CVNH domain